MVVNQRVCTGEWPLASKKIGKEDRAVTSTRREDEVISWRTVFTLLSALGAAWLAAGSLGLIAHPLRRMLVLVALIVCAFLHEDPPRRFWAWFVLVIGAGWMLAQPQATVHLGAVVWVLACLASHSRPAAKRMTINAARTVNVMR